MTGEAWDWQRFRETAEPLAADPSAPAAMLGKYRLGPKIAQGAMGIVYEAEDSELHRPVAVKILQEIAASSGTVRARFQREALAAARLSHPNVVQVFDAGEAGGRMYLVMELVRGEPLAESMARRPFDLRGMILLLEKAARGLAAAHDAGIVHRDVKPANILVTADGEPKVADFGLAHWLDSQSALTKSGAPLGTPMYMSPEQVRGGGAVTPATDVYALGAILYEILTGRTPHGGGTTVELYGRIVNDDPVPPRRLGSRVDADLETICLKALEKEAERRYPTAGEFANDLRRHLSGEPILARPTGALRLLARRLSRRKAGVAAILLAAILVPGGAWAWMRIAEEQAQRRLQERLKPLESVLERTQSFNYIGDVNLPAIREQLEEALAGLDAISREEGGRSSADVWRLLGLGWQLAGDDARAEEALLKALPLDPGDGQVAWLLGRIYLDRSLGALLGRPREPADAGVRQSRAWNRKALEYWTRPVQGWGRASALDRHVATAYRAFAEGDLAGARRLCEEGLRRFPADVGREEYFILRGHLTEDPAERIEAFTRALERRPQYAWALMMRGATRCENGQARAAIEDFTAAIAINPRLGHAWFNRAIARAPATAEGRRESLADLETAGRLLPDNASVFLARGILRKELEDPDGAFADLDRAIALDPATYLAFAARGQLRMRAGRRKEAAEDFGRALELAPAAWPLRDQIIRWRSEALRTDPPGDH